MWGDVKGTASRIAITRSNKARTNVEPTQVFNYNPEALWRIYGDGRLGPLDLLVNMTPTVPTGHPLVTGIFHARVLPMLSATVSVKQLSATKFKLTVKVTDAGDPVSGATVSARAHHKTTNSIGVAKVTVAGSSGRHVTVTITVPGYKPLNQVIAL
jgi:hypothetical protein